jgi:acyl-CoA hydrolase
MNPAYKTVSESQIDISKLMLPSYSNFSGKIHGGYILSMMDEIAFACASRHSQTYCVTASVDTVDFRNPIEIGELVTMHASINYVGKSSMVVGIRVESEHIQSGRVKHCNSSYFTMVAKNEQGENVRVPGLILKNEDDVRRFLKSIKRKEMKKARQKEFHETDFSHTDYLDQLKHYNVKLALE